MLGGKLYLNGEAPVRHRQIVHIGGDELSQFTGVMLPTNVQLLGDMQRLLMIFAYGATQGVVIVFLLIQ